MKRQTVLWNGLIVLFCAVFLFAAVMLIREQVPRWRARQEFEALAAFAAQGTISRPAVEQADQKSTQGRDIAALQKRNPHCIGWVCIPDTRINYPVMYTPNDPLFYLRRNFDGGYSVAGTPFLDHSCTFESENLILYGHNMQDGSMFAALHDYLDEDFRREHSVIEFETANGCACYEVVDVRRVDMHDEWYNFGKESGETQYLTLSTCGDGEKSGRVILIAQRVG